MESQNARGYFQGAAVPASFKDPVNGAHNSGNTIHGGSSTNSSILSAMRVFFHAAVDSIVIEQRSFSEWIVAELMVECNYHFPATSTHGQQKKNEVLMIQCEMSYISPAQYHQVARSVNGTRFYPIEQLNGRPFTSICIIFDRSPVTGKNHCRLKTVYGVGYSGYSDILTFNWINRPVPFDIFPNPALLPSTFGLPGK
jgi:hypothetical protein